MASDETFLRTVRSALGQAPGGIRSKEHFPDLFKKPGNSELLATINGRTRHQQLELTKILKENCSALNATSHIVSSLFGARQVIVELVRSRDPEFSFTKHIIQHHHPDITALQLWKAFNREAVTLHTSLAGDEEVPEKSAASFIGITAPSLAVADSGTVIQITEPGRPRSTSLVPSIHIALVRRENIVANLEEAYCLLARMGRLDSFVFISGPSKTADIEAQLVHGAHGPREIHLIILSEPEKELEPAQEESTHE